MQQLLKCHFAHIRFYLCFLFLLLLLCFGIAGCLRAPPSFFAARKVCNRFFLSKTRRMVPAEQTKSRQARWAVPRERAADFACAAPSAAQCTLYVCECVWYTWTILFFTCLFILPWRGYFQFNHTFAELKRRAVYNFLMSWSTGKLKELSLFICQSICLFYGSYYNSILTMIYIMLGVKYSFIYWLNFITSIQPYPGHLNFIFFVVIFPLSARV